MQFCKLGIPLSISKFHSLAKWNPNQLVYFLRCVVRTNSQAMSKQGLLLWVYDLHAFH